jgi:Na+-transporting methylmalonyl-CoA/oxaloacetate decarboxylase gamma subunit
MDRHNSSSSDEPPSDNPNIFDDEYALDNDEDDFMPGVADGFRPTGMGMSMRDGLDGNRQNQDQNDASRQTYTTPKQPETDLRRMATRNSIAKVPIDQQPITYSQGPSSRTTALQHRESVSSTASFATMGRSDSPLPSGPSHPYGMYPQNTVARASSVATAPAQQLPQPPVSRQGPTHPYGMYPQNTVEDEVPLPVVQATIPVGFPGLPAGYHRQIGPDGEEQDIIGPDGHSEQLPPYTRFPQEGPTKAALAAEMNSSPIEATALSAVPAVSAHRSNDALVSPVSPTSSISSLSSSRFEAPTQPQLPPQEEQRQAAPVVAASIPVVSTEQLLSEKQEPARNDKPKNWRSKKLWGILPMGVALILLILVLIFAVILGAAIGTFVAKNKDKGPNENKNKDKDHDDP